MPVINEKAIYKFTVRGILPDLNQEIKAAGSILFQKGKRKVTGYSKFKKQHDNNVMLQLLSQMRGVQIKAGFSIVLQWYCVDKMKDKDNIAFAIKYILDGMQLAGLIPNDGWRQLSGSIHHDFFIDKSNPRVDIFLLVGQKLVFNLDSL